MHTPLVSIIIPTYNYSHLITHTLNCLLHQDYQHWEAIIVDDGSEDNTEEIVRAFAIKDPRFNYIRQVNAGVSSARNKGIKLTRGKYIQFLDADDLLSNRKIARQVEFHEQNPKINISLVVAKYFENDISETLYSSLDKNNTYSTPKNYGQGFEIILAYLISNQNVIQSPLFKRSLLEKIGLFQEKVHYLEDWEFWFRFAIKNCSFSFIDEPDCFVLVRIHAASASKNTSRIIEAEGPLRSIMKKHVQESDLPKKEKIRLFQINRQQLINTYKALMAKTKLSDLKKISSFYNQMDDKYAFCASLLKSLNIKRKNKM